MRVGEGATAATAGTSKPDCLAERAANTTAASATAGVFKVAAPAFRPALGLRERQACGAPAGTRWWRPATAVWAKAQQPPMPARRTCLACLDGRPAAAPPLRLGCAAALARALPDTTS